MAQDFEKLNIQWFPGHMTKAQRMIEEHMKPLYDATLAKMPTGRFGEPVEVAKAIVFVASPAVPYMTGANIVVDGGFTQRVQF